MFCEKCGVQNNKNERFCAGCGATIDEQVDSSQQVQQSAVSVPIVMDVETGAVALNGQRQIISTFEVMPTGQINYTGYLRTKQSPAKNVVKFTKQDIQDFSYKRTVLLYFKHKVQYVSATILALLSLLFSFDYFIYAAIALTVLTYWGTLYPTLVIRLRNGKAINVYYDDKQDTEHLVNLLSK